MKSAGMEGHMVLTKQVNVGVGGRPVVYDLSFEEVEKGMGCEAMEVGGEWEGLEVCDGLMELGMLFPFQRSSKHVYLPCKNVANV
jgi:hypothetical protein